MTQEFHISVTPVGQNDYLVRTEQVAPGVPLAEELVTWPVADWLAAAGHLMNDPLRSVLQGDALTKSALGIARNSVNLVALGQQFYNALFHGTLRDSWITAQGIAQNHQQVLRLRLGLKDNRLARLPWEVMHAGDRPLATGPYVAFSRYQSGLLNTARLPSRNLPQQPEDGIVRVLMVLASPTDQTRLGLLKQEAVRLQAELQRHLSRTDNGQLPEIDLTILDQPGREELTQALEQGRYQVLHYSGHSNLGPNGGEIYLVSNRTGLTETLSGDDLAGLLVNNNIQMAVFNSCWGAYTATSDTAEETGERNLTESLVRRGIKCVLAMSERIPDEVALTLTQLLYRNLSQGYPVDLCVSRVRQGLISAYGSHQTYWALPILYLQPEFDGFLGPEISNSTSTESLNDYTRSVKATTSTAYAAIADDAQMPLPIEEMIPPGLGSHDASDLDWLGEETWGDLVDEIEYDDPTYAEDSAIVSDLFRQLDHQKASNNQSPRVEEPPLTNPENHFPARQNTGQVTPFHRQGSWGNPGEPPKETPSTEKQPHPDLVSLPTAPPQRRPRRNLRPVLGIVGAGAIATVIGLGWWWHRRISAFPDIPQIPTEQAISRSSPKINLQDSPTSVVTNTATEKLSQGDLPAGLAAVEELLDRNVLTAAQTALDLIPPKQVNEPSVNFMKGRLAWQLIQTGNKKYSIDDARRYWETAAKAEPDSLLYANALGFAYYAENNLNRANDSWFKALNLALNQQKTNSNAAISPKTPPVPRDALTPYAGLALGLYKSANNQPATKQTQYMNEAIKLRKLVINQDPVNFQANKLSNNWLWTEKAIGDWRSLLEQKVE
ncbi:cell division protein HetF [Nostoc sp. FACHB-110]|uniref:cell division protein HetF n=1 Tax=Nostoc sp. FACHB-110 TaxID=2692834 RepID=UPI001681E80C|nr:cell division protein HetF [Nostoc sp. FACHB-110]MBD2437710.1 CHAT domain-containing protein [Nostoc sp. FACHB-110]